MIIVLYIMLKTKPGLCFEAVKLNDYVLEFVKEHNCELCLKSVKQQG